MSLEQSLFVHVGVSNHDIIIACVGGLGRTVSFTPYKHTTNKKTRTFILLEVRETETQEVFRTGNYWMDGKQLTRDGQKKSFR